MIEKLLKKLYNHGFIDGEICCGAQPDEFIPTAKALKIDKSSVSQGLSGRSKTVRGHKITFAIATREVIKDG